MSRQSIKIILVGIIALAGGLSLGIFGGILMVRPEMETLHQDYDELYQDYDDLQQDYSTLAQNYADLLDDYNILVSNYSSLFSDYNSLRQAFEEPLTSPITPTISQVLSWLSTDDTDTHNYTSVWQCGDFSAMLMTRAKEMNWRMRISCMFFSFNGDAGYGSFTDPYGAYGHAFNMIMCSDGLWYYIEPQTDAVWHIGSSGVQFSIWFYYDFTNITGTVWDGNIFWSNHYSYFA